MFYFAYGSNLNSIAWSDFCDRFDADPSCIRFHSIGHLQDHRLSFNRYSVTWGGGALSVVPCTGSVVEGVLFEIDRDAEDLLDIKEGVHGGHYIKRTINLQSGFDRAVEAICYFANAPDDAFETPAPQYFDVVSEGLNEHGLSLDELSAAAENRNAIPNTRTIFAYGTLKPFGRFFDQIQDDVREIESAYVSGRLYCAGAFPCLVQPTHPSETVVGQMMTLSNDPDVFDRLDWIEGHYGFGDRSNLFTRWYSEISCFPGGQPYRGWVYRYNGDVSGMKLQEDGRWSKLALGNEYLSEMSWDDADLMLLGQMVREGYLKLKSEHDFREFKYALWYLIWLASSSEDEVYRTHAYFRDRYGVKSRADSIDQKQCNKSISHQDRPEFSESEICEIFSGIDEIISSTEVENIDIDRIVWPEFNESRLPARLRGVHLRDVYNMMRIFS